MKKVRCCICGNEIRNLTLNANNPHPIKNVDGNDFGPDDVCCSMCDGLYVLAARIALAYGHKNTYDKVQQQAKELQLTWKNQQ